MHTRHADTFYFAVLTFSKNTAWVSQSANESDLQVESQAVIIFFYMASAVVHLRCQTDEPKGCPDSWKKGLWCAHPRVDWCSEEIARISIWG